jgi:hypothetical protein
LLMGVILGITYGNRKVKVCSRTNCHPMLLPANDFRLLKIKIKNTW